jgi:hypothetical protein
MSVLTLIHPEETREIPSSVIASKCSLFQINPTLLRSPYVIRSKVPVSIFRQFTAALTDTALKSQFPIFQVF